MAAVRQLCQTLDLAVANSKFGRLFRLQGSGHEAEIRDARFLAEVRAGLTTFFTMAYIIAVNASIMTDSGGPCVCDDPENRSCAGNAAYSTCLLELNRDFITATAASAAFASFFFGLVTNLPVALASGMGLNAYLPTRFVGFHGTGRVPYGVGLTAVFTEGFIFVILSLLGMRQWLVRMLPTSLKVAAACGIGLYLAAIGLSYSAGIGAITGASTTPLDLGGCPTQYLNSFGECKGHRMQNPSLWIGVLGGGVLTAYLMSYRVKSAMIIGILVVSVISWPRDTPFTYFPRTADGDAKFEFFKQVVSFRPLKHTLNALEWDVTRAPGDFALALFTFLYVDIIDCTATLYSMARFSGVVDASTGDFPRSTVAYCSDALSISFGSLVGVSPITAFIESGAGIAEGGKTGLTAMTTGLCFFISIFFAPIFASIPPWATGCTLVLVGAMMVRQVVAINWGYLGDAVPAFVTIVFIPMSYSTAYGLLAGIMTYAAINGPIALTRWISRGRIVPVDEDAREYWTYKPGGQSPWFVSAAQAVAARFGHDTHRPVLKTRVDSIDSNDLAGAQHHGVEVKLDDMGHRGGANAVAAGGLGRNSSNSSVASKPPDSFNTVIEVGGTHGHARAPTIERFDLRQFRVPPERRD